MEATATAPARVVSVWNPANAVTASRFLTLPPLYWAVMHDERQLATLFIVICGLLDKLDGLVAKLFNCRSAFGELFDAVADASCYGFALLLVAAHGWAPWIPVIGIIVLGLANTGMRVLYAKRLGRAANYKSYAMERVVAYTAFLIGFATGDMEVSYFYWLFLPVLGITLLHDAKRMLLDPV